MAEADRSVSSAFPFSWTILHCSELHRTPVIRGFYFLLVIDNEWMCSGYHLEVSNKISSVGESYRSVRIELYFVLSWGWPVLWKQLTENISLKWLKIFCKFAKKYLYFVCQPSRHWRCASLATFCSVKASPVALANTEERDSRRALKIFWIFKNILRKNIFLLRFILESVPKLPLSAVTTGDAGLCLTTSLYIMKRNYQNWFRIIWWLILLFHRELRLWPSCPHCWWDWRWKRKCKSEM